MIRIHRSQKTCRNHWTRQLGTKKPKNGTHHGNPQPSFLGFFRCYNPYIGSLKPSFFMVLASKGICSMGLDFLPTWMIVSNGKTCKCGYVYTTHGSFGAYSNHMSWDFQNQQILSKSYSMEMAKPIKSKKITFNSQRFERPIKILENHIET